jgi:hypothetical protein
MKSYKAIWADDLWKKDEHLKQTLNQIIYDLKHLEIEVEWKLCLIRFH